MAAQARGREGRRKQGQKYPRLSLCVPATGKLLDGRGVSIKGESQNLSQGGIQLRVPRRVAPGTRLRVTLQVKGRGPLALPGRVIWSRPHPDLPGWAVGVRFAEPLPSHLFLALIDGEEPSRERLPWLEALGAIAS